MGRVSEKGERDREWGRERMERGRVSGKDERERETGGRGGNKRRRLHVPPAGKEYLSDRFVLAGLMVLPH